MIKGFDEIRNEDLADIKIEYNYHTHNYLCGHADGTVSDYVKVAVGNGLKSLGVSDHFAQPALPNCPYMNFDKLKKENEMTEDEQKSSEKSVQDLTDKYIKEVDNVTAKKSSEIMAI